MEEETSTEVGGPQPYLAWLIAPVAILLAFIAGSIVGADLTTEGFWLPAGMLFAASALGTLPRITPIGEKVSPTLLRLAYPVVVLAVGWLAGAFVVSAVAALLFVVLAFAIRVLDGHGRYEASTIAVFSAAGVLIALLVAAQAPTWVPTATDTDGDNLFDWYERDVTGTDPELIDSDGDGTLDFDEDVDDDQTPNGQEQSQVMTSDDSTLDTRRTLMGFAFFSAVTIAALLGLFVAVAQRGTLMPASTSGWFSYLPLTDAGRQDLTRILPFLIAIGVHAIAHVLSLGSAMWQNDLGTLQLDIVSYWWAMFTGLAAYAAAFAWVERWRLWTLAIGFGWVLHSITSLNERGIVEWSWLDSAAGSLTMTGIVFLIAVAIGYIWWNERFWDWSPRDTPTQLRAWWGVAWAPLLTTAALVAALVIRVTWNVIPAMNASGTGLWDMTGGSDPWYMKRAVDYVLAQHAHFIVDSDRAYPIGSINPRPPLFTWSMAVAGILLAPLLNSSPEEAVWWAIGALPAIYGALTVLPIAAIARRYFGVGTGVLAAWLIALMPGHVGHSTFALADHDAFVMLFLALGFHYYLRAIEAAGSDRLLPESDWRLSYHLAGVKAMLKERPQAMAFAVLAGVAIATVALGWKGFVYGPAVMFASFFVQVILNLFRRRDSLPVSVVFLTMVLVIFLIPLPYYAHPQLKLLIDPTGFQPMFYIGGFALATAYIVSSFRDKPWLLVIGSGVGIAAAVMLVLWLALVLDLSNAWNVLFSGGGYFSQNKVFGTIAEAQAPSRGTLFGSFGPLVGVTALIGALVVLWRGMRRREEAYLVLGVWAFVAAYMAWTAGRFVFNATPIVAVMGAYSLVWLWGRTGGSDLKRLWKRMGTGTPRARVRSIGKLARARPAVLAVMLLIYVPAMFHHATFGLDSGIPRGDDAADELDDAIYDLVPEALRYEVAGWSVFVNRDDQQGLRYLGSFGPGFNGQGWNRAYAWLAAQDTNESFSERPAFISWWDYGFQALAQGQHPSVSDNFQSGIPASGNMLLARGQDDLLASFIYRIVEGDVNMNDGLGEGVDIVLKRRFTPEQYELFTDVAVGLTSSFARDHVMTVEVTSGDTVIASGWTIENGVRNDTKVWRIYRDHVWTGQEFDSRAGAEATLPAAGSRDRTTTHYIFNDYWYTNDSLDEFDSVATSLHRENTRIALSRAVLTSAFDMDELVDLYHDLTTQINYVVQDTFGDIGETVTRNHEIRYFTVDNRLYPLGGRIRGDQNYNFGNPSGIFYAPTTLSGLDPDDYLKTAYETVRGDGPTVDMTPDEFEDQARLDALRQQSGTSSAADMVQIEDIRTDHQDVFFDTMISRAYSGYGASTLGLSFVAQAGQHFGQGGTPGTAFQNWQVAPPMPGAMQQHFVIANWYDSAATSDSVFRGANTAVKVLKYYSGAQMCGTVQLADGTPVGGARVMIERDAFSGEDAEDFDPASYWIPITAADTDGAGRWCATVPAGHMRATAFIGEADLIAARDQITAGQVSTISDLIGARGEIRPVNPITGILAEVAGMQWLGESELNVTGDQGHSNGAVRLTSDIVVDSSGASGVLQWRGHELFDGDAVVDTEVSFESQFNDISYSITTANGTVTGNRTLIGQGEATFGVSGFVESSGVLLATNFTGTYTRTVANNQTYVGNGSFSGNGSFRGTIRSVNGTAFTTAAACGTNNSMPDGAMVCTQTDGAFRIVDGPIEATGRFTANGTGEFSATLDRQTFEGAGTFEGTGTFNGTGVFSGEGVYTGPMVRQGSFAINGMVPGTYDVVVRFSNGLNVTLPEPLVINTEPLSDGIFPIPGNRLFGNLTDLDDNVVNGTLELVSLDLPSLAPTLIQTADNGSFEHGPVPAGNWTLRMDLDGDGWYELNATLGLGQGFEQTENVSFEQPLLVFADMDLQFWRDIGGGTLEPVANRTLNFTSPDGQLRIPATTNASGFVQVELAKGLYVLRDELDTGELIWQEFDLTGDTSRTITYVEGVNLSGRVLSKAGDELGVAFIPYTIRYGNISIDDLSKEGGNFSARLPAGIVVNVTVTQGGARSDGEGDLVNGSTVTVTQGMAPLELVLEAGFNVAGKVEYQRDGVLYTQSVPGWGPAEVRAVHAQTGTQWYSFLGTDGSFSFSLPGGDYNVTVLDERIGANTSTYTLDGDTLGWLVRASPANISVNVSVFIDLSEDGNMSNGTPVGLNLSFIPTSANGAGQRLNLTVADFVAGNWSGTLEPGAYAMQVTAQDPTNGSDHDTVVALAQNVITVDLGNTSVNLTLPLVPRFLLDVSLQDSLGQALNNTTVLLSPQDGVGPILTYESDANGTLQGYVPQGDWFVTVAPFDGQTNETELLRMALVANETATNRVGATWQTQVAMTINSTLHETNATGRVLPGYSLIAVSQDGLGNITLPLSDNEGNVSTVLFPGSWHLMINRTDAQARWLLDGLDVSRPAGGAYTADIVLELRVALGGNVFWDLDADSAYDVGEGIVNATVQVQGGSLNETTTTNADGTWQVFVPIMTNYTVNVNSSGYGSINWTTTINSTFLSNDTELVAGTVGVSGQVDWVLGPVPQNTVLTLMPRAGIERADVTPTKVLVNGTWMGDWTADVTPGDWILVASADVNGTSGLPAVAVGLLEAGVIAGGEVNVTLRAGGSIVLSTAWQDLSGNEHHLGDTTVAGAPIRGTAWVTLDLGAGRAWNVSADANGVVELVLPAGSLGVDGTFWTTERGVEMTYTGGVDVDVTADLELARTLSYARRLEHAVGLAATALTGGTPVDAGDFNDVNATASGDGFTPLVFTVQLTYEGNELADGFALSTSVSGSDGDDWLVEFQNGSVWNTTMPITLGLDGPMTLDLTVRVTPPNATTVRQRDDGHTVTIAAIADDDSSASSLAIKVRIPQTFGVQVEDGDGATVGVGANRDATVGMTIKNTGNGDDSYTVSVDRGSLPAAWTVSTPGPRTVSASNTAVVSVNVRAPADAAAGAYDITLRATSEDGNTFAEATITVELARSLLTVQPARLVGGEIVKDRPAVFEVIVTNTGLLATDLVTLYANHSSGASDSESGEIPASGSRTFTLSLDLSGADLKIGTDETIEFELDPGTTDLAAGSDLATSESFEVTEDTDSNWQSIVLAIVVGALVIAAIVGASYGFRQQRRRKPF